jgi:glycosyltransferase involved in cell wall biosynthesis
MSRLLIIQPYIPSYRVPLFRGLRAELADSGIEMRLIAGRPQGAAAMRGDEAGGEVLDSYVRQRAFSVGGKSLNVRSVGHEVRAYRPDRIVVEQAVKNLETYPLLVRDLLSRSGRVGMWGQGRTFSTAQSRSAGAMKDRLTRRSDWFFSYTQEGADYVVGHGYDPRRVTVLNNTINTGELSRDLQSVSDSELDRFRREHGLTAGLTAIFMGGVDPDKGIDFLLAAARRIGEEVPGFRLLVAGAGRSAGLVRQMQSAGEPVVFLGRVEGEPKALALRAADLMMIPQWVGLVAVDSLVAGRPIVTTRHSSHSPEFGYLTDGSNAIVCDHDVASYASAVVSALRDRASLAEMQLQAISDSQRYSLSSMVGRFAGGVRDWMVAP